MRTGLIGSKGVATFSVDANEFLWGFSPFRKNNIINFMVFHLSKVISVRVDKKFREIEEFWN